jgi:hypothetical protein
MGLPSPRRLGRFGVKAGANLVTNLKKLEIELVALGKP